MSDQLFTVELTQAERRVLIVAIDYYQRKIYPGNRGDMQLRRNEVATDKALIRARHKLTQATPTGHEGTL